MTNSSEVADVETHDNPQGRVENVLRSSVARATGQVGGNRGGVTRAGRREHSRMGTDAGDHLRLEGQSPGRGAGPPESPDSPSASNHHPGSRLGYRQHSRP